MSSPGPANAGEAVLLRTRGRGGKTRWLNIEEAKRLKHHALMIEYNYLHFRRMVGSNPKTRAWFDKSTYPADRARFEPWIGGQRPRSKKAL